MKTYAQDSQLLPDKDTYLEAFNHDGTTYIVEVPGDYDALPAPIMGAVQARPSPAERVRLALRARQFERKERNDDAAARRARWAAYLAANP